MITSFRDEYEYLSNFYEAKITYDGITFRNSEAAYQAQKCADRIDKEYFFNLPAKLAKKVGRRVEMVDNWDEIKLDVMQKIIDAKFDQHPELAEKLISTGDEYIEEGNYWKDTFWGVCDGVGENHLGKILMNTRQRLKEQYIEKEDLE